MSKALLVLLLFKSLYIRFKWKLINRLIDGCHSLQCLQAKDEFVSGGKTVLEGLLLLQISVAILALRAVLASGVFAFLLLW